jgi:hypothetical protein
VLSDLINKLSDRDILWNQEPGICSSWREDEGGKLVSGSLGVPTFIVLHVTFIAVIYVDQYAWRRFVVLLLVNIRDVALGSLLNDGLV